MDVSLNNDHYHNFSFSPFSDHQIHRSNTDISSSTTSADSNGFFRTSSGVSSYSDSNDTASCSSEMSSPRQWPLTKILCRTTAISGRFSMKQHAHLLEEDLDDEEESLAELEMMMDKFSKLMLGEDMSGSGKGVCTAVAVSNAITNLYATVLGDFKRLEPLSYKKKMMWRKEMNCLLSICDYIKDANATQDLPDETTFKVMETRSDIAINLPALQQLDTMLIEILDSFYNTEFWYIEKEAFSSKVGTLGPVQHTTPSTDEKWWLPLPCVPPGGLSEKSRKRLHRTRKCANQIHKLTRSINSGILSEMAVPETYMATLPKTGRANIGDIVYDYMSTSDQFSPDCLLDHLEIKSEHEALDVADRIEASMFVWRRKANIQSSRSSWNLVKEKGHDGEKNEILASRAESVLRCLKNRYPELSQTTLDTSKIQYNKDVGQAILESYSRVLESLAFNIVARIDDVLQIDGSKQACFLESG